RRLPGGFMAELYLAKLQNTRHFMVVKGVPQKAPASFKEALKREAEILKKIRLETIPEMYGYFEEKEKQYFIMSYHEGSNLEELLSKGSMPEKQIKEIALDACRTLAYLHKKGIIYSDLKPSNMIWCNKHLILLDFGAALFSEEIGPHFCFRGTVGYAAPEWFREGNRKITYLADVFSLGATLYRLLERQEPKQHYGKFLLMDKQKRNRWQSVLDKCCAPEPEKRYRSMAHIYDAINNIQV
ncbi:MAG: serine/threonine protein kinase, partial [Lachnospiraceae bacterium]|nr:serine/threonine protein kinase [Lachnospiraceae bacterium]